MAVSSVRKITIDYSEDLVASFEFPAAENEDSPGVIQLIDLALGANTITVPTGGSTPTGVTIIPPDGNTVIITLKKVAGDIGIALGLTDPTSFSFDSTTFTSFVLSAADVVEGLRLVWS